MTEYQYHWWPCGASRSALTPTVRLEADLHLHGAALALKHFKQLGCDIATPLAHVDMNEPDGTSQTLLVEDVLDRLNDPKQTDFLRREDLAVLLR